jgi:hypothetical protein
MVCEGVYAGGASEYRERVRPKDWCGRNGSRVDDAVYDDGGGVYVGCVVGFDRVDGAELCAYEERSRADRA